MPLILPSGMAKGCLPRDTIVDPRNTLAGLGRAIRPQSTWHKFIGRSSYRQHWRETFYQNGIGSCAADAMTMGMMLKRVQMGQPHVRLNPWSMYYTTSRGRDEGSTIQSNLEYARDYGVVPDEDFPRYRSDERTVLNPWNRKPPESALQRALPFRIDEYCDNTSILEVGSCLCDGIICPYGWEGHSCILLELTNEWTALALNSWGQDWGGDDGFFLMDLREIDFRYGCFGILSVRFDLAA